LYNIIDNYILQILNSRGNTSYNKTHKLLMQKILTHKTFIYMTKYSMCDIFS